MKPIDSIDLNLLKTLDALLRTGSITESGNFLGLSQPAASRAVAKLRTLLGDPLLVRSGSGYILTSKAVSLRHEVALAISAIDRLFAPSDFTAESSERTFKIGATDYGTLCVILPLMPVFLKAAPMAGLSVSPWASRTFAELESGELDIALYDDGPLPKYFHYENLFDETYVAVVRRGHPLTACELAQNDFAHEIARYRQVVARYPSGDHLVADDVLGRLGVHDADNAVEMPYFSLAPLFAQQSDLVMLLPAKAACNLAKAHGMDMVPLPTRTEDFAYRVVWHERAAHDPGRRWLVDTLVRVVNGAS